MLFLGATLFLFIPLFVHLIRRAHSASPSAIRVVAAVAVGFPTLPTFAVYVTTCPKTSSRLPDLMEFWGHSVRQHRCCVGFWIVSLSPGDPSWLQRFSLSEAKWRWIDESVMTHSTKESRDLYVKDMVAFDHFFWNTTADWCFRVVDDCYVNSAALDSFLARLRDRGDPTQQALVVGNCVPAIQVKNLSWYLQGCAFGLSRNAAGRFLQMGTKWFSNPNLFEDYQFSKGLETMGLTSAQVDSPFFTGHKGTMNVLDGASWSNIRNWGECPMELPPEPVCSHRFVLYRDVVFHHMVNYVVTHRQWDRWVKIIPDNAVMFYRGPNFVICQVKEAWNGAADRFHM
jgi:hypothetical protein